jgi:hypothetical protein
MRKIAMKTVFTSVTLAFTLIGFTATRASAQNPFLIDGTVTDTSNSHASGDAKKSTDPNGNAKELGPVQGSSTKFPIIHLAAPDMLGTSNPNPSTDLNTVYTQTTKSGTDSWFYFGWVRDSDSGSGFISFEAHQKPNTCASYSDADLHKCNPWSPRTAGDFTIFWDQSGNSTNVYLRTWDGTKWTPDQPGTLLPPAIAIAQYSADLFRGELALNLTAAGLVGANECRAFANVIPGTITGNSQGDQADFKDVVLAPISINTCGSITVTKVTLDPAGAARVDTSSSFDYKITNSGAVLNGNGDTEISSSIKGCTGTPACAGPTNTHADLTASGNYTLTETTVPGPYALVSIVCGGTDVTTAGSKFSVPESGSVACTITNQVPKSDPAGTTAQTGRAQLFDDITITGIQAGAANAASATATFKLYSDNSCSTLVGTFGPVSLTYSGGGTTASASTLSGSGISVSAGTTYYWRVTYSGDAFNNGFTTACGSETGLVTFTFVQ